MFSYSSNFLCNRNIVGLYNGNASMKINVLFLETGGVGGGLIADGFFWNLGNFLGKLETVIQGLSNKSTN